MGRREVLLGHGSVGAVLSIAKVPCRMHEEPAVHSVTNALVLREWWIPKVMHPTQTRH